MRLSCQTQNTHITPRPTALLFPVDLFRSKRTTLHPKVWGGEGQEGLCSSRWQPSGRSGISAYFEIDVGGFIWRRTREEDERHSVDSRHDGFDVFGGFCLENKTTTAKHDCYALALDLEELLVSG